MRASQAVVVALAVTGLALTPVRNVHGQTRIVAPVITSVAPQAPSPTATAQMLTVNGSNFSSGVSLNVVAPDGKKVNYPGSAITARRDTSFQVAVLLATAGKYTLIATNQDGTASNPFTLMVAAPTQRAAVPRIERVLPDRLAKDPQPQVITVRGERFAQGLSVSLTDPIGTVYRLKAGPVTSTSFDLSVVFEMMGDYTLMVTNPSGESSNSVTFTVVMRAGLTQR